MAGLAERLRVGGPAKDLRLGDTFNKASKAQAYHTIRYDFKPQSIDTQKMGTVEVEENHEVTVAVPHREGSGQSQTVFKGNEKPIAKECLLIIDHNTGEISLERISTHINVKKTREEGSSRINSHRPPTPLNQGHKSSPPQKFSPPHNSRNPVPTPTGSSPSRSRPSPSHHKVSPPTKMSPHRNSSSIPSKSPSNNFMPSMGSIGSMPMCDFGTPTPHMPTPNMEPKPAETGLMSDSSSDSSSNSGSSSSSDSDSDSEGEKQQQQQPPPPTTTTKGKANGHSKNQAALGNNSDSDSGPDDPPPPQKKPNGGHSGGAPINLNDDLQLSEDDSDDSD